MDANSATLQLPKDLIESAIQQHVAIAMSSILGDGSKVLERAVQQVLNEKVDDSGKRASYSRETCLTYIQWVVNVALREAVKKAVNEEVGKYADQIRSAMAKDLASKNSPMLKQLVESMTKGIINAASDRWSLTVAFKEQK